MTALRKIVTWFFALEALLFGVLSLLIIWSIIRAVPVPGGPPTSLSASDKVVAVTLLVVVLSLGPFYVAVWWKTWQRSPAGRGWVLAGSLVNVILGLTPPLLSRLPLEIKAHASADPLNWGLAVWGFLGLIAFWDRAAWARESLGEAKAADDTSELPV